MIALRWALGLILAGLGAGSIVLVIVANGFRKSFGSSAIHPVVVALPILAAALLLASIVWPTNRTLMHVAAIAAVCLLGFGIWQLIAESATVMWWFFGYLLLWFYFYWRTIMPATVS